MLRSFCLTGTFAQGLLPTRSVATSPPFNILLIYGTILVTATSPVTISIQRYPNPAWTASLRRPCVSRRPVAPPGAAIPPVTPCSPGVITGAISMGPIPTSTNPSLTPYNSSYNPCFRRKSILPPASASGISSGTGTRFANPLPGKMRGPTTPSIGPSHLAADPDYGAAERRVEC